MGTQFKKHWEADGVEELRKEEGSKSANKMEIKKATLPVHPKMKINSI